MGDGSGDDTLGLAAEVWRRFLPAHVLVAGNAADPTAESVPLLAGRPQLDGTATAYVCEHFVCQRPVTEPAELAAQLGV